MLRKRFLVGLTLAAIGLTAVLGAAGSGFSAEAAREAAAPKPSAGAAERNALEAYGKLPLAFVRNAGQSDPRVRYSAQASGASFAFTPNEALFAFTTGKQGHTLGLRFLGASKRAEPEGTAPLPGRVNYLLGNDPAKWRTGLPTYGEVVYRSLWPGIDLAFRGDGRTLKYELRLAPGAEPDTIRLAYRGQKRLSLGRSGGLRLDTSLGVLRDSRPVSYQLIAGRRVPVASSFVLGQKGGYGFEVGSYDVRRPLVIDPGLLYSTYLGGGDSDAGNAIALDAAGNAYVTGLTSSSDFPTTPGAFDTSFNGAADAFVTKLNPAGSAPLLYSTYLGGSGPDFGFGIAVDAAGNAYVTGSTRSADFPTTPGAFDTTLGFQDAFVTKLNAAGSALLYSTYLGGGSDTETGEGIALDPTGEAYVTGLTSSVDFPTTPGAFDTMHNGAGDAFVTKLNATGSAPLLYSTYLGGGGNDFGFGIAVDAAGSAFVIGQTFSAGFPTTPGAFDTTHNGDSDAFVTKLNATGSAPLLYSTYLGGSGRDIGKGIAIDAAGDAYVTGSTNSADFPTTPGAFDATHNGTNDAFVTKLNATGSAPLLYSTYLGGGGNDLGEGIAVDAAGNAYVTGITDSADYPTTPDAFDTSHNGGFDAFVTKLNATGSAPLLYSTYLGGSGNEFSGGIAVDAAGNAYVTGNTFSTDYPTTPGAFDTTFNGAGDAFVTKLDTVGAPGPPATLTLDPPAAVNTVGETHCVTATVRDAVGTPVPGVTVRFSVPTAAATAASPSSGSDVTDANGEATFCYSAALPGEDVIHAFADTDDDGMQDTDEPFGDATKTWILPPSTELCEVTITQGGWIVAANGDRASFGGTARVRADGSVDGHENYQDHGPAQPRHVRSIELTALTCSEDLTAATIFGRATVDGSGDFVFRIDVTDMGNPGSNDTYGITMSDGYASGRQRLQGGNVQIHRS